MRKEKQVKKIMHPLNKVTIFPSDVGGASWWEELVCGRSTKVDGHHLGIIWGQEKWPLYGVGRWL